MTTLQTKPREGKRIIKKLRREGDLPAVFDVAGNQLPYSFISEGKF